MPSLSASIADRTLAGIESRFLGSTVRSYVPVKIMKSCDQASLAELKTTPRSIVTHRGISYHKDPPLGERFFGIFRAILISFFFGTCSHQMLGRRSARLTIFGGPSFHDGHGWSDSCATDLAATRLWRDIHEGLGRANLFTAVATPLRRATPGGEVGPSGRRAWVAGQAEGRRSAASSPSEMNTVCSG